MGKLVVIVPVIFSLRYLLSPVREEVAVPSDLVLEFHVVVLVLMVGVLTLVVVYEEAQGVNVSLSEELEVANVDVMPIHNTPISVSQGLEGVIQIKPHHLLSPLVAPVMKCT